MKLPRRTFLHLAAGIAALPAVSRSAWAQAYPTWPVCVIVPAAAGSGHDIVVRLRSRLGRARHNVKTDDRARVTPSAKSRENIRRPCRGKVSLSELGWPNLLLRDKLPTGNEQGSAGMATVGNGAYTYEPVEDWAKLPPGWSFKEIGGVGVDRHDNVFVFNRGEHPMIVFDRDGNFLRSFGEGMFPRAHGVFMAPDDTIWLTDDGDHTVRQCTPEGKVLLTLGISGKPAPFMSGEPFHRCTHTAMSPQGDIYVSDGYGNSRVHKYAPNGKLLLSWGGPGTDPGEFNIAHNITCDADGWVYVADRENHRVQVFDGNGKYETQWNNLHRPCGLFMPPGKCPVCYIANSAPCNR
jgi:streptogramin lyase